MEKSKIYKDLREHIELDSIRFISVTFVVLHHLFFEGNAFLSWMGKYGWVGVDIFFCLSGYIITKFLLVEYRKKEEINYSTFIKKRILRLWPSWLIALFLSYSVVLFFSQGNPDLASKIYTKGVFYFAHLGNYSYAFTGKLHGVFGHFWSLAVEEHFYLMWPPLLVYGLKKRRLGLVFAGLLLLPYLFRLLHHHLGLGVESITLSTHTRLDSIAWGCLLSFKMDDIKKLTVKYEFAITATMIFLFYIGLHHMANQDNFPLFDELGRTVISLASCLLIIIALKGGKFGLRSLLRIKFISWLGLMSYGVYLFHVHTNILLFAAISKLKLNFSIVEMSIISNIIAYIPAILVFYIIDKKIHKNRISLLNKIRIKSK